VEHIAHSAQLQGESKFAEALSEAETAVALTPNSVRAHLAAGKALSALNRKPEAEQELETTLRVAAENGMVWYPIQIAEARRELQESRLRVLK